MKDDTTGFGYQADNPFDQDADWAHVDRLPAPHLPLQRDRPAAVAVLAVGLLLLRIGRATTTRRSSTRPYSKPGTNRLNIGAPITIPAGRPRSLGRSRGHRHRHDLDAQRPERLAAPQGGHARDQDRHARQQRAHRAARPRCSTCSTGRTTAPTTRRSPRPNFGQPVATSGNAYVPRQGQLGVRFNF